MGCLEDQILQLPLSTAFNSSGSLSDRGKALIWCEIIYKKLQVLSLKFLFMSVVKTGPSICVCVWLVHLNVITRIPVIPQL